MTLHSSDKPKRLYFETCLQMVRNSVGTTMFRTFYIVGPDGKQVDSLAEGDNSCAFFVSSVLTILKRLREGVHGTVESTKRDLAQSGWQELSADAELRPGDVLVWEAQESSDGPHEHIGFYMGDGRAISTSSSKRQVAEHDAHFDGDRAISQVFRCNNWA